MAERQHTLILVVRRREPSPVDRYHLVDIEHDVADRLNDIDTVYAFSDLKDLLASVEAGDVDLD